MARGVRGGATILSPNLQPQSVASYDPITRRNTILVANIVPVLNFATVETLTVPADRYYAHFGAAKGSTQGGVWAPGITGTLNQWDATGKRFYLRMPGATSGYFGGGSGTNTLHFIHYAGPFGQATSFAPKNADSTEVRLQFRARFGGNIDYTVYGIGATTGPPTSAFTLATAPFIQVTRNVGSWELGTCDGTTISQSAGGTADGSFHDFKIVWVAANVTLYVDGVSTIVKTSNLPPKPVSPVGANAGTAADVDIVDYLVDWSS
ncbi:MAG: hypothetical protein ACR2NO_05685 [Chloroflexota bacterium]